jgi:hypothetical protein
MNRYSALLKDAAQDKIAFMNPLKARLEGKEKMKVVEKEEKMEKSQPEKRQQKHLRRPKKPNQK